MDNLYENFDKSQANEIAFGVYFSRNRILDIGIFLCFFAFLPAAKPKYPAGTKGLCQRNQWTAGFKHFYGTFRQYAALDLTRRRSFHFSARYV
ncbi:hypothetical protein K070079E91_49990 [Eisenbergiella porci]